MAHCRAPPHLIFKTLILPPPFKIFLDETLTTFIIIHTYVIAWAQGFPPLQLIRADALHFDAQVLSPTCFSSLPRVTSEAVSEQNTFSWGATVACAPFIKFHSHLSKVCTSTFNWSLLVWPGHPPNTSTACTPLGYHAGHAEWRAVVNMISCVNNEYTVL